jgi:hypothetical protein
MKSAIINGICRLRGAHCSWCLTHPEWRDKLQINKCPHNIGLGDKIEAFVKPIAKSLGFPCLDENQNLKPHSGCAKRRDKLNALTAPKKPAK